MKKLNVLMGVLLVGLVGLAAVRALADAGISDPTISLEQFSPSSGIEMKEQVLDSLESLETAVEATIDSADAITLNSITLTVVGADLASAGTGTVTIQAKDAAGNDLDEQVLIHTWIGTADDFGPDALTDYSVGTGTQLEEVLTNAHYTAISDTNGVVVMDVDAGGADSVWAWGEIQGQIYESGEVELTAP